MNTRKEIHRKIFLFLSMGLAFFMPVASHILPAIIVVMTINGFFEGAYIKNFPLLFKENNRFRTFSLSFLYLFYLAGMLWSHNFSYGWFDLEVKFSLLLFPLIFSTIDFSAINEKYRQNVLAAYVAGCVTGMVILCVNALYRYSVYHVRNVFFYTGFSGEFHAGYLSMYLVFALSVCAWFLLERWEKIKPGFRAWMFCLVLFFMVMIFLLSSKAGLVSLLILMLLISIYMIVRWKKWMYGLTFLILGLSVFYGLSKMLPASTDRFSNVDKALESSDDKLKSGSHESNADRLMVWKGALRVIKENPFTGTGTGDVKDHLMQQYLKDGAASPLSLKLNAHNQYLQTFATLGITGFLLLLYLLFLPMFSSLRNKDYLSFAFVLVFAFNILFESMFEQQQGVIFFAFFNTMLLLSAKWQSVK